MCLTSHAMSNAIVLMPVLQASSITTSTPSARFRRGARGVRPLVARHANDTDSRLSHSCVFVPQRLGALVRHRNGRGGVCQKLIRRGAMFCLTPPRPSRFRSLGSRSVPSGRRIARACSPPEVGGGVRSAERGLCVHGPQPDGLSRGPVDGIGCGRSPSCCPRGRHASLSPWCCMHPPSARAFEAGTGRGFAAWRPRRRARARCRSCMGLRRSRDQRDVEPERNALEPGYT